MKKAKLSDLPPHMQDQARAKLGLGPEHPETTLNKYNAKPSKMAGRSFASRLERDRAAELVMLEECGEISGLEFQPMVKLSDALVSYKPDFMYTQDGRTVYEDAKGVVTDRFRMIKRLWSAYGPALLRITKRNQHGRIVTVQEVIPR